MIPRVVVGRKISRKKAATSGMASFSALVLLVMLLTLGAIPAQATVDEQAALGKAAPTFESLRSNPDRPEVVGDQLLVAFRKGINALAAQQWSAGTAPLCRAC